MKITDKDPAKQKRLEEAYENTKKHLSTSSLRDARSKKLREGRAKIR